MSYDFGGDPVDAVGNLEEAMRIYSAMCEGPEGDPPAQVIDLINELDRRDEIGDDGFLGGYSMGSRLVGKVALISGAARGMGSTEAGLLVDEGAKVVLGDLLDKEGQFIADDLNKGATSKRAIYLHLDVTSANDWANAVAIAVREFSLNVLVNNAGVLSMLGLEEETEEGWQRVVDINQKGVWLGMRAAVPAMRRAGGGSIVNISSMYGLIGSGAATAYQGSKGAVRILIKTAAVQYAPENIRVNSVHPGITTTPMVERGVAPEGRQAIVALTPLRREARPEEVAYAVLFLASDEGRISPEQNWPSMEVTRLHRCTSDRLSSRARLPERSAYTRSQCAASDPIAVTVHEQRYVGRPARKSCRAGDFASSWKAAGPALQVGRVFVALSLARASDSPE